MIKLSYKESEWVLDRETGQRFLFFPQKKILNYLKDQNIDYSIGSLIIYGYGVIIPASHVLIGGTFICFDDPNDEILFKLKFW